MKFIKDIKNELQSLLEEKEANKEMKLIRRIADKKMLSSAIIIIFILVTLFVITLFIGICPNWSSFI